ncbi:inter-alpha-trypsin inhibitor heavy chain H3-like [Dendropsophus ebraccatus]|uniref:inter-alpha-trypsin inhibitor heavy chain H3-like n=1 Tax=Dendropsophus ebraccatus TaxID=150705 RepID=UPI003831E6BF
MDHLLLFTVFISALTLINGDFVIEGLRNIQRRSIDQPVKDIEVYSIDISSQVTSRFAHNVITSRAVNKANMSKEAIFDVDLPNSAFITNFSMIIDGEIYPGVIKEKEAAKKQYDKAVSRGQTAGLVRASGGKTEKFTVSVNVAPESKVTFELVYEEMLKRRLGKYEMFIKVQPKTLVKSFQIEVEIHEAQGISFLDAQASFITNDLQPAIKKSVMGKKGHVSFKPAIDQQRSCANCETTLLKGDFTVTYDVNRESPGNIQGRDLTNINDPLLMAVELLNKAHESKSVPERSVSMIILLTDGEANVGESNPAKIQENVKKAIQGRYTLYSLAFGYDVDYPFLEKLALENSGIARRIYEDSDAASQLKGFYTEIANPTLTDIEVQYPENAVADLTNNNFRHYFEGGEIVVAGRVMDNDVNSFIVDVKADGAATSLKYTEEVQLEERDDMSIQQKYIFGDFTERLWAYLTIQQLLEKRLHADLSEKVNLTMQALDLSLKFKFVTPLTSMVVIKPEENGKGKEELIADKFVEVLTKKHNKPSAAKSPNWVDSDPHFVINVPQKNDALCFNIQEKPGAILNLIEDRELGISVNGELIAKEKSNETYFGRIGIVNRERKIKIEVTTDKVTVLSHNNKRTFSWQETGSTSMEGFNLVINKKANVTLSIGEGATFFILLHEVWKSHPFPMRYLGFYTLDDYAFSKGVHGLLGQFFHGIDYEISNRHKNEKSGKQAATMKVKNHLLAVTRGSEKDYRSNSMNGVRTPCWFVHSNGEGLIDGSHTDYIVPDIFSNV